MFKHCLCNRLKAYYHQNNKFIYLFILLEILSVFYLGIYTKITEIPYLYNIIGYILIGSLLTLLSKEETFKSSPFIIKYHILSTAQFINSISWGFISYKLYLMNNIQLTVFSAIFMFLNFTFCLIEEICGDVNDYMEEINARRQ